VLELAALLDREEIMEGLGLQMTKCLLAQADIIHGSEASPLLEEGGEVLDLDVREELQAQVVISLEQVVDLAVEVHMTLVP
jgi:hypothetical protein